MKEVTLRLLACSILAGSAFAALAATTPPVGVTYNLYSQFPSNPPSLVEVGSLPKAAAAAAAFKSSGDGVTTTDGAGRIHGVQYVTSDLGGGTQVVFQAKVSGSVVGRGKVAGDTTVHMTIKAPRRELATNLFGSLNLTFKGSTALTPNTQTINTAAPGFNIRLAADGTTNRVERFDPWQGAEGVQQGWSTYQMEVHSYSVNSTYTTNGPEAQPPFSVNNRVNALIQNVDLAGYDHYNQEYVLVKFGTPIKTDRGDGYYGTNSYGCITMNAGGGTTVTVPLWIIDECVATYAYPGESGTNYGCSTNLIYGADIADLGKCLDAYHAVYDTTSSSAYSGSGHSANQYQTNYAKSLIAAVLTNTTSPSLAAVVKGGRCVTNCWTSIEGTLDGTISAGKTKLVLKKSPAAYEESHELWTPIASAPGEESYLVQPVAGNLALQSNGALEAAVQQSGRKLTLTGSTLDLDFSGSGTVTAPHGRANGTYTARLTGMGSAKGSALNLKGSTRTLITGYEVITDAPPVIKSLVNVAADGAFTFFFTNTISGRLQVPAKTLTYTDVQDNVVSVVTYSHPALNVDNPFFKTNTVAEAIGSVIVNGKVMGQKWSANTVGFNAEAPYPDPLPVVPAP